MLQGTTKTGVFQSGVLVVGKVVSHNYNVVTVVHLTKEEPAMHACLQQHPLPTCSFTA